jgi:small conductance mechanosensitive channel
VLVAGSLLTLTALAQAADTTSGAATDTTTVVQLSGCEDQASTICDVVYDLTGSQTAADLAELVIGKPLRILIVLVIAYLLTRLVRRGGHRVGEWFIDAAAKRRATAGEQLSTEDRERIEDRATTVRRVAQNLAIALIWVIAALIVLAELGVNLFPLIAAAGIAGVAIGLGAQTLVRDFLNGLLMLVENQMAIGDEVDLGEADGVVEALTLRTTTLRDGDGNIWYVPNSEVKRLVNKSQLWARAVLDVRVDHAVDLEQAKEAIRRAVVEFYGEPEWSASFLDAPTDPTVHDLAVDAVVVRVSARVRRGDKQRTENELRVRIKRALEKSGIALSLPQQVVHLRPSPT